jgi:hypothetical protein
MTMEFIDKREKTKSPLDHEHHDKFYYCPICMQYQYPDPDKRDDLK